MLARFQDTDRLYRHSRIRPEFGAQTLSVPCRLSTGTIVSNIVFGNAMVTRQVIEYAGYLFVLIYALIDISGRIIMECNVPPLIIPMWLTGMNL